MVTSAVVGQLELNSKPLMCFGLDIHVGTPFLAIELGIVFAAFYIAFEICVRSRV